MKYKVGDRVRVKSGVFGNSNIRVGMLGTLVNFSDTVRNPGVRFDEPIHGHHLDGYCEYGYGWYVPPESLELADIHSRIDSRMVSTINETLLQAFARFDPDLLGDGEEINTTKPKKTIMTKLNTMMKKLLDTDTQTLVKAGFINGDLDLTSEGKNELWTIIFDQNKAALVEAAKAKIAEEEKE